MTTIFLTRSNLWKAKKVYSASQFEGARLHVRKGMAHHLKARLCVREVWQQGWLTAPGASIILLLLRGSETIWVWASIWQSPFPSFTHSGLPTHEMVPSGCSWAFPLPSILSTRILTVTLRNVFPGALNLVSLTREINHPHITPFIGNKNCLHTHLLSLKASLLFK